MVVQPARRVPGLTRRELRLEHPFRVAHAIPGRARMQLDRRDRERGPGLAARLAAHPAVSGASWRQATRSLTVHYDRAASFASVLGDLPESGGEQPPVEQARGGPLWRQFVLPAIALVTGLVAPPLLARAVIGACAVPIARRAARGLLRRRLSIDVMDSVAVGLMLLTGDVLAAGVTVGLVETGEGIRRQASGRARRVLRSWMGADPRGIRLLRDGREARVPVAEVSRGDRAVVYAGEAVPVDGVVVEGRGGVDTRTWTGEPLPKSMGPGSRVLAGSALHDGRLVLEVTAMGDETRAGRLAAALEEALAADTRVSDLVYRLADRFVLPVLLTGGVVFAVTRDLGRLASVVIVDFGAGLRVSVPTAVLATMMAAARRGVLFKSARAVEALAEVDTIVFDKTGTLTTGRPAVVRITPLAGAAPDVVLRWAASAEGHLQHPIARAVRQAARRRHLDVSAPEHVDYQPGGGVAASVEGRRVAVGDARLLRQLGVRIADRGSAGSSVVLVAADGELVGRLHLRDSLKDTAGEAVAELRRSGVRSLLLATGDHPAAAAQVSRRLGLDGCRARMLPEGKAELVRSLRADGRVVAVVGDGINDAGAMAEASVAVAVPDGADLARETADVSLLGEDLKLLATAIQLARDGMSIVRQDVGLVAAPNVVGLALAVLGRLTPLSATLVNNGSTLLAGANSLRPLAHR